MKKISIRRQTALDVLISDDEDGEFDYANYSDEELWDAFIGAGYISGEGDIYGDTFVSETPENCVDARELANKMGWPISLED